MQNPAFPVLPIFKVEGWALTQAKGPDWLKWPFWCKCLIAVMRCEMENQTGWLNEGGKPYPLTLCFPLERIFNNLHMRR